MKLNKLNMLLALSLVVLLTLTTAFASAASTDFPKKMITWIVTYAPGGGFDSYARAIGRFMPKYLPNKIKIIIKNVPGAGGRSGTNVLYRAKPDGYTIGILNIPGVLTSQMIMKTKYDLTKFEYIGSVAEVKYPFLVSKNSPYKSLKDLQQAKKPVRITTTGVGSSGWLMSAMTCEVTKIPYTFITGYKGSVACLIAVIRGDGDASMEGGLETQLPYIREGELIPLFVVSSKRQKYLPDLITIKELGYPELAPLGMYRLIAAPPKTPKDRLAILEKALMKTLEDKDFLDWSKSAKRSVHPANGKEARGILDAQTKIYEQYKEMLKRTVKK